MSRTSFIIPTSNKWLIEQIKIFKIYTGITKEQTYLKVILYSAVSQHNLDKEFRMKFENLDYCEIVKDTYKGHRERKYLDIPENFYKKINDIASYTNDSMSNVILKLIYLELRRAYGGVNHDKAFNSKELHEYTTGYKKNTEKKLNVTIRDISLPMKNIIMDMSEELCINENDVIKWLLHEYFSEYYSNYFEKSFITDR